MSKIKLGLLDDHQIVIDGLKNLLTDEADLEVLIESTNGSDFIKHIDLPKINIALLDVLMPTKMSGTEVAKYILSHHPNVSVLILSMCDDAEIITELIENIHVHGFISKASSKSILAQAIRTIHSGKTFYTAEILSLVALQHKKDKKKRDLHLSKRELQIIQCIQRHLSNKQIADELFISIQTVETHRKNIYSKTNTKGEAALMEMLKVIGVVE
jgi:two-component system, NarL family, nitrate/nitrite response regulator NarL